MKIINFILILIFTIEFVICEPPLNYLGVGDTGVDFFPVFEGLHMHIRCYTNSSVDPSKPIMLFDAGLPFFSTAWSSIIKELVIQMPSLNFSKACFIDRYGYGWSDPAPYPFTTQEYVRRLHGSLQAASIQPPFACIGWSWGSIGCQTYAMRYPSEIKGLFTIDGTDPIWGYQNNQGNVDYLTAGFENFIVLKQTGQLQAAMDSNQIAISYGYFINTSISKVPPPSVTISRQWFNTDKFLNTGIQELNIMIPSAIMLNNTYDSTGLVSPLKDLPFVVLYETINGEGWEQRQRNMSLLSTNSEYFAIDTSHFIPFEAPDSIILGIQKLAQRMFKYPSTLFGQSAGVSCPPLSP